MSRTESQQRGIDFEQEAAEVLGLAQTSNSGAGWVEKSDAKGKIRLSCKSTSMRSWSSTRSQLREAIDLAQGTGEIPALAVEDEDGEQFLVLRLSDAARLLIDEARVERRPRRSSVVRDMSSVPALLRDSAT